MGLDRSSLLLLRIEGFAIAVAAAFVYSRIDNASWLLFVLLFLVPDLSFVGYLAGPRVGAWSYNLVHAYVGPILLLLSGIVADSRTSGSIAIIWFAHIGFDRALGYGLKTLAGFGDTHLGRLGKPKQTQAGEPTP